MTFPSVRGTVIVMSFVAMWVDATISIAQSASRRIFSFEDLRLLTGVGGVELSPDGRTAVVTVTRPSYERNRNESELYAVDVASGAARQITFQRRSAARARFSPDGRTLAFLSPDSAGRAQVWLMPMNGGEASRLTAHPTPVTQYSWRPDGGGIAFLATDEPAKREGEARHLATFEVRNEDLFLRRPLEAYHIWVADVERGESRRLTRGAWTVEPGPSTLSWSPDGTRIAFAQMVAPGAALIDSVRVAVLDIASGAIRPLTSARTWENEPTFSPDGQWIVYTRPREGRAMLGDEAHVASAGGGEGRSLTRALDRNLFVAEWMPDGRSLLVAGNDRGTVGAWIVGLRGGAPRRLDLGDLVINGSSDDVAVASRAPVIAFIATTQDRPSELYVLDSLAGRPRRLTDFNAWVRDFAWSRMERVTWATDSFEADGVVSYPPHFDPSRKYPLVVLIHGGPTSSSKLSFSPLPQLLAAQGWVVLQPNYRGSDNLGNAYQAAIFPEAGAGPGRDVMSGVAVLRRRPYVDSTRTAVMGSSYGGFMTAWLIGNYPGEWKAAVAGSPITTWEEQYALADNGRIWPGYLFGGSPWTGDRMAAYREQSPITYVRKIRTPTLVTTNMEDFRVPPAQAFALHRALRDNGVETKLIGFAGRAHSPSDPVNARERWRLWIDWVKTHLEERASAP